MSMILIVDDDVGTCTLLEILLTRNGFDCASVHNSSDVLDHVRDNRPDLILLDIMMPGVDGTEICRAIRADESISDVPIIMLTALSGVDDKVRAFEAGADDYVTKPVHKAELLSRIKVLLARRAQVNPSAVASNEVEWMA